MKNDQVAFAVLGFLLLASIGAYASSISTNRPRHGNRH